MENMDLLKKVQQAESVEELFSFAKENHLEVSEEEIKAYYNRFHKTGEMTDNELDDVSGGSCYKADGRLVVSFGFKCDYFRCNICKWDNSDGKFPLPYIVGTFSKHCTKCGATVKCKNCIYMVYENALWLCSNPKNRK